MGEIGYFLSVWFTEFPKGLEISTVIQVAELQFKIAWYGLSRELLKNTLIYGFDLCDRNGLRVTAKKCKSWGRATSISHLAGCTNLVVSHNPK